MKYIKLFDTHLDYLRFIYSCSGFVRPNVSLCLDKNEVHYNSLYNYLTFVLENDNNNEIGVVSFKPSTSNQSLFNDLPNVILEYSLDNGDTWDYYEIGDEIVLSSYGDSVKFRGENTAFGTEIPNVGYIHYLFDTEGPINVYGDLTSITNNMGGDVDLSEYPNIYRGLFEGSSIVTAPKLPSTVLSDSCYMNLFANCSSLTTAPILASMIMEDNCYSNMFSGCTSLTIAPELPSTILADHCYEGMFSGCQNLSVAPSLPAVNLYQFCYASMFAGCDGLTTTPELPAKTLVGHCYESMFYRCHSLLTADNIIISNVGEYCCSNMFNDCTLLYNVDILITCNSMAEGCFSHMFEGCTSLTEAPALDCETLANNCYAYMFFKCSMLSQAPVLPAINLVDGCYDYMFASCSSLKHITALFVTNIAETISGGGYLFTDNWLLNVASNGTFVKNEAARWRLEGPSGIPHNWNVVTQ